MKLPMIRTNIYLEVRQRNILKTKAILKGIKMAELVRKIIDNYLEEESRNDGSNS